MEPSAPYFYTPGVDRDRTLGFSNGDKTRWQGSLFPPCTNAGMKGTGAMRPSSMFYVHESDVQHIHHFLEECSLCGKTLSGDIFMYRGDTPFCSEECRQQQIEVDRAKHRRKKHAAAHAVSARKEHRHHHHHHHRPPQQQPRKESSQRIPVWA